MLKNWAIPTKPCNWVQAPGPWQKITQDSASIGDVGGNVVDLKDQISSKTNNSSIKGHQVAKAVFMDHNGINQGDQSAA